jgi:uncharacterized protein (TIGR02594 family)
MRLLALLLSLALVLGSASAHARPTDHHQTLLVAAQPEPSLWSRFSSTVTSTGSGLVSSAKSHIGATASQLGLPGSLWCADFMNQTLHRAGYKGTGSRTAKSFLALPRTTARVGAIAVMGRRGGGHVGIVSGFDASGNPVIVSGNHNHRVREATYSGKRIIAYVSPR